MFKCRLLGKAKKGIRKEEIEKNYKSPSIRKIFGHSFFVFLGVFLSFLVFPLLLEARLRGRVQAITQPAAGTSPSQSPSTLPGHTAVRNLQHCTHIRPVRRMQLREPIGEDKQADPWSSQSSLETWRQFCFKDKVLDQPLPSQIFFLGPLDDEQSACINIITHAQLDEFLDSRGYHPRHLLQPGHPDFPDLETSFKGSDKFFQDYLQLAFGPNADLWQEPPIRTDLVEGFFGPNLAPRPRCDKPDLLQVLTGISYEFWEVKQLSTTRKSYRLVLPQAGEAAESGESKDIININWLRDFGRHIGNIWLKPFVRTSLHSPYACAL